MMIYDPILLHFHSNEFNKANIHLKSLFKLYIVFVFIATVTNTLNEEPIITHYPANVHRVTVRDAERVLWRDPWGQALY